MNAQEKELLKILKKGKNPMDNIFNKKEWDKVVEKAFDENMPEPEFSNGYIAKKRNLILSVKPTKRRVNLTALLAAIVSIALLASATVLADDIVPLLIADNVSSAKNAETDENEIGEVVFQSSQPEEWQWLTEDDYKTLEKNEDGVIYLKISEAEYFILDGTVIITDDNGEPFEFIFNESDYASVLMYKNMELSDDAQGTVGIIVDEKIIKQGTYRLAEDVHRTGVFGISEEFDSNTKAYAYLYSEEPIYVDRIEVKAGRISGVIGGPTYLQYHFGNAEYESGSALISLSLEDVRNISIGNSIRLDTSDDLLKNMKKGTKVYVTVNMDITDGTDTRWNMWLYQRSDGNDSGLFEQIEMIQSASTRLTGAYVEFEIPEDGDYFIRFENASFDYIRIVSTAVEIK